MIHRSAPADPSNRPLHRPARTGRRLLATVAALATAAAALALPGTAAVAAPSNRVTPGNFTGYGFDQCSAPTQAAMDAWLKSSPFWAVGIYISGDSRACRNQPPHLNSTWVSTQLKNGWRVLPITLGPQASCSTRFPRYDDDETIKPRPRRNYAAARRQGWREAVTAVEAAQDLGIVPGSTLWYDLEGFDSTRERCRESAIRFLHAWTRSLHDRGYVSGVYSSAASGIRMLDDVRVDPDRAITLPDRIWIADWDGKANVSSVWVRPDGWLPGNRMKQYRGGHDETHGGVTINIDSNYLDLGRGSRPRKPRIHCGGVNLNARDYPGLFPATASGRLVAAAECLLAERGHFSGTPDETYDEATIEAVRAFRTENGLRAKPSVTRRVWMMLHSAGRTPLMKYGSGSDAVRRLQRALNAGFGEGLKVTGTFEGKTTAAVKRYQAEVGLPRTGVVTGAVWAKLKAGNR